MIMWLVFALIAARTLHLAGLLITDIMDNEDVLLGGVMMNADNGSGWERHRRTHFDNIVVNYDRVRPIYPDELIRDEYDMVGDFGYSIGKAYWNKGYTTEALTAVLRYGLLKVGFNRLEAYHSIQNMPSGKVMKKSGMTYEGRARRKYKSNVGFEDCDMYSIIKEDLLNFAE